RESVPDDRVDPSRIGFVRLMASGQTLVLNTILSREVPLDLCLERQVTRELPKLTARTPQLVHRAVYRPRLRTSISSLYQGFAQAGQPRDPFAARRGETWLLRPVVDDGREVVLLDESVLILLDTGTGTPTRTGRSSRRSGAAESIIQTENVMVVNRPTPPVPA